ncbi:Major facilitator superfamily domain general substrate transporter [Penicillium atrosanguineum]|uniref:Major facilitator superfamily domain general substrate transporter n=1 Tax=Penicillium atrosanguineum TaxID=1132637 RepID=UPI00239F8F1A|nr:Major facilitator superfamily domain general substrate transporter [Penicillium atrosanguineum]KAJ5314668.1 Major facilitator superfamily domain general substrate transporter [Penicillium atrosanguineum]
MAPQNVGIKAIEIYFPSRYVTQSDLEKFLGASTGKYTIGLGQTNMSFCDDREDLYSLALTAVSSLLQKYTIEPNTVGRLEVGTESMLDKAKSCKSVLMQLFPTNPDIEGADTYNACYGGTNAFLNAVHWIESSSWDGRDAIVVMSDIALYKTPAARPTGGAGCIAMLIGADAPIVLEPVRASYMRHTYDFYKPDFKTEYPLVDGHYSSRCYLQALDGCYQRYWEKKKKKGASENGVDGDVLDMPLDEFDYFVFHAPNCKLVSKSYARLMYNDSVADKKNPLFGEDVVPIAIREQTYEGSLDDKSLEKFFIGLSRERFNHRVQPSLTVPTMCGNMYTAGVYSGLVSLLSNTPSESLINSRVGVFSFGSGLASTLFSLRVVGDVSGIAAKIDLHARLASRDRVSSEFYDEMCRAREQAYQQKNYTPTGSIEALASGTYYLSHVDEKFRRSYAVRE